MEKGRKGIQTTMFRDNKERFGVHKSKEIRGGH
jgi:hypothetical protein